MRETVEMSMATRIVLNLIRFEVKKRMEIFEGLRDVWLVEG
jgi:hypothetical protein